MKMIVNTVRIVDNDQLREFSFGDNNSLKEKLGIGLMNPKDFGDLRVNSNLNIRITNNFGSVVIKPIDNKNVPMGTIIMPVSIWANQITGIEKNEPIYKNIEVNTEVTSESVLDINDLLNLIKD
ncbi:MAG: hypothetical protein JSV62_10440 [Promethearchaeota archaeon]|nr:MAG: hypothetical protein JSV62_10440 [Candidatus Lokiarchaeota archaeon]